ncbi:hypothetical protein CB1_000805002 [Camelus ferus]|nr:hypothetical protein CB1_000805002 [Camelus ferus]
MVTAQQSRTRRLLRLKTGAAHDSRVLWLGTRDRRKRGLRLVSAAGAPGSAQRPQQKGRRIRASRAGDTAVLVPDRSAAHPHPYPLLPLHEDVCRLTCGRGGLHLTVLLSTPRLKGKRTGTQFLAVVSQPKRAVFRRVWDGGMVEREEYALEILKEPLAKHRSSSKLPPHVMVHCFVNVVHWSQGKPAGGLLMEHKLAEKYEGTSQESVPNISSPLFKRKVGKFAACDGNLIAIVKGQITGG